MYKFSGKTDICGLKSKPRISPSTITIVTEDIIEMFNKEYNIEILRKWARFSARADSLEDFVDKIN
ncbi:hypothetical protein SH2C18_31630 [Clostridium sediminicola]|uniref:hypothetical protein n=1 Tax=Clostridium sediminicola TaxID=3114879 RepID=UPI0031F1F931